MTLAVPAAVPIVPKPAAPATPPEPPDCAADPGSLCSWVWGQTEMQWLAVLSSWDGLGRIGKVFAILVMAIILRWVLHRAISRLTVRSADGVMPAILRPLRERAPDAFASAAGLLSERRTQRAQTIGSVLRSVTSAVVFGIAGMMALDAIGFKLAPILASAGVVGLAIGFGAQNLVKDFLSGMFMMLEDQYGVGDVVDLGEASGTVESVGLRVTSVRDAHGVVWYIRNGEIVRVGNKSQGWAVVNVDVPLPFGTDIEHATQVMQAAADDMAADDPWKGDLLAQPEALGVEQITTTGLMLRVTVRTTSAGQWRVARELRARLTEALGVVATAATSTITGVPAGPPADVTAAPAGSSATDTSGPT